MKKSQNKKLVLLEIGVGYNTPIIIKYPFEHMTYKNKGTSLIRINKDYPICSKEIIDKSIMFDEKIQDIIKEIKIVMK